MKLPTADGTVADQWWVDALLDWQLSGVKAAALRSHSECGAHDSATNKVLLPFSYTYFANR